MQRISFAAATAVGLGAIIGAGIFVLSGTAIALAGSYALLAFILVGIVVLIVAFEIGELASLMPYEKGASYSYAYKAFGSEMGFVTGLLLWSSYATGIAVIALGFGSYLANLLSLPQQFYQTIFAGLVIIVTALINMRGVRKTANTDLALVLIKSTILLLFVLFAIIVVLHSSSFPFKNFSSTPTQGGISSLFYACVAILFAYSGFQTISSITSRVQGGGKSAAKAIVSAVLISMVLYLS